MSSSSNRTGLLTRLWQAFASPPAREPLAEPEPEPGPPLFRPRPVPPPPPRGPGLPAMDDILREAPPAPDPRHGRLSLVTDAPAAATARAPTMPAATMPIAPATAAPPAAGAAADRAPAAPRRRLLPAERRAAERVRALIGAGLLDEAEPLLEAHFAHRPELLDAAGLPIYLVESFRCAVQRDRADAARRFAAALRPLLAADDPLLEAIIARAAVRRRDFPAARAAWAAVLARAPGNAEAMDWLNRHPATPDGGIAASELISGPRPLLQPPPPPPAGPQPLPEAMPAGTPGEWLRHVAIRLADGQPATDGDWSTARDIPGARVDDVAVVLRDPDDIARAAVFPETALALFALAHAEDTPLRLARLYAGRQPWAARANTAPQPELLAVLFPGLRVVAAFDGAVREHTVLTLDGAARAGANGMLIGGIMPLVVRTAAAARARMFAAVGLPGAEQPPRVAGRRMQALYLEPTPALALADAARARLFAMLQAAGFEVTTIDMTTLPLREQVRRAAGADLLFGIHGPAMTSVLWAHPQARVLELFPPGVRRYDTQLLAEAASLTYLGLEGLETDGFVTRAGDRFGPPAGNPGGIVSELPWAILTRALTLSPAS